MKHNPPPRPSRRALLLLLPVALAGCLPRRPLRPRLPGVRLGATPPAGTHGADPRTAPGRRG